VEHQGGISDFAREVIDAKRRLEGIVASAMDAIITVDEAQNIILFNPAAEQMFLVSAADALGQPISRFIPHRYREAHGDHIRRFRNTGVTGRRMGALGAISGLRSDGEEFPVEASISQVEIGDERLCTVILRDITERKSNEEARQLLAREVDHRAKNALAVVQALVSLTTAPTKEAFVDAVVGRVSALARAHSLLAENRWKGADLHQIISDETIAYAKAGQVQCDGPIVMLAPNAVQPISLLIHELATNAVKYGALSSTEGSIAIAWRVLDDNMLEISWAEHGGPPVLEPHMRGFGSTLIRTVTTRQLLGRVSTDWNPAGVRVAVQLPPTTFYLERQPIPIGAVARAAEVAPPTRVGRLLLVEDEPLIGMDLSRGLEGAGWEVLGPAGTIEEAFQLLADGGQPDVAILDIKLNGELVYPVADLLQSQNVPFLFCSGYGSVDEDKHQKGRFREHAIIRKPTSLQSLLAELRRLVMDAPSKPAEA
jgi:PAS domain S-box-containing protein